MGVSGRFDFREFEKFAKNIQNFQKNELEKLIEETAKEIAARLLRKVVKKTKAGKYKPGSGKVGGTLRRGWTAKTHEEAAARTDKGSVTREHLNRIEVKKTGNKYVVEIANPVFYAMFVEYGHRTRGGGGWVDGKYMLTIAENEINCVAQKIVNKRVEAKLKELFR